MAQPETAGMPWQRSLSTDAARNLSSTTKTQPQMQEISPRWLLRALPWVQVMGGTFRVNKRLQYPRHAGRFNFSNEGAAARVVPPELSQIAALRGFTDPAVLESIADLFIQHVYKAGEAIVEAGKPADELVLIVHGKVEMIGTSKYEEPSSLAMLRDGGHFGEESLTGDAGNWEFTARALTSTTVLRLKKTAFVEAVEKSDHLRGYLEERAAAPKPAVNGCGESLIQLASGHWGEPELPETFVDYEPKPREYELSLTQTVLHVHTRVADLYNAPMNQVDQQLRLTIEAIRERQERELMNNPEFGLLHSAAYSQRIPTRSGPPTPDDMDELLATVWKEPTCFLAHPRTIAAFGAECSQRGIYPHMADMAGHTVPAWRGVPILPCNKIPVSRERTSSVVLMRTGEHNQGVVGLHQTGIPDEYQPSLSVRFMGIDEQALISYLVTAYYSAAVLVPDALGILEDVEIGH